MTEADWIGRLKHLGAGLNDIKTKAPSVVKGILGAFAIKTAEGLKENLSKAGKDSGSNLSQSIDTSKIEVKDKRSWYSGERT